MTDKDPFAEAIEALVVPRFKRLAELAAELRLPKTDAKEALETLAKAYEHEDTEAIMERILFNAKAAKGFVMIQAALFMKSQGLWEELYNKKHPDRVGQAWEDTDPDLMFVWHDMLKDLFREHYQEDALNMSADEYRGKIHEFTDNEEVAETLIDYFTLLRGLDK